MVDAVQAIKATSDRGDVRYPIKVFNFIFGISGFHASLGFDIVLLTIGSYLLGVIL